MEECTDRRIVNIVERMRNGDRARRTDCPECGGSRTLLVNREHGQGRVYCFRGSCGYLAKVTIPELSLPQSIDRMRQYVGLTPEKCVLPLDIVSTFPAHVMSWFGKASLSEHDAANYGMYWSGSRESVVLPVMWRGELDAIMYRPFRKVKGPKYIMRFRNNGNAALYMPGEYRNGEVLWIVEDALSAIRMHKLGYCTAAALGTSCNHTIAARVIELNPTKVCMFLDGDRAGETGVRRFTRMLEYTLGLHVPSVRVPGRDPKHLTNSELREMTRRTEWRTDSIEKRIERT